MGKAWMLLLAVASLGLSGCAALAREVGKGTAEGALQGAKSSGKEEGKEPPAAPDFAAMGEKASQGLVRGGLEALSAPEQQAQIRALMGMVVGQAIGSALGSGAAPELRKNRSEAPSQAEGPAAQLARQAARAFAEELGRELSRQLGPGPEGTLASSLAQVAERVSASTVRGAREQLPDLAPECTGPDRARCLQGRLQELGRATSAGMTQGVRANLGLWPIALAFLFGVLLTVLLASIIYAARVWPIRGGRRLQQPRSV